MSSKPAVWINVHGHRIGAALNTELTEAEARVILDNIALCAKCVTLAISLKYPELVKSNDK
jgi:hypothetical protein